MKELTRFVPKKIARFVAPTAMAVSAAVYGGAVCAEEDPPKSSELQNRLEYSLTLPSAPDETWWFTAGPHYDEGSASRVKYAIDLTPIESPLACPGSEPVMEKPVRAIADGVVTVVGNEKDPKDKNHSVVEVDHGDGFSSGYMHLDDMQVDVGQTVNQGDELGYVSCEVPPGGRTDGQHLHFYGKLDGKPIEVDRIVMSGWTVEGSGENNQGTMSKSGEDKRTADRRRCGPQTFSIRNCDKDEKIRNDISWKDPHEQYIATPVAQRVPTIALVPTVEQVPTVAPVPTLAPVPTVVRAIPSIEVKSEPLYTDLDPYNPAERPAWIRLANEEAYGMAWKFVNHLMSGTPSDLQAAFDMQIPEHLEFTAPGLRGFYSDRATLEMLQGCSIEMDAGQTMNMLVEKSQYGIFQSTFNDAQYLNFQQGYNRERATIGISYTHNIKDNSGRRVGFKNFSEISTSVENAQITFEVVGSKLYIAEPTFCTYVLSPLNN